MLQADGQIVDNSIDAQLEDLGHATDLEDSLAESKSQRAAAQGRNSRTDTSKYPVLTLPNEITIEMFLQFLPTYPLCSEMTGLYSPTLLTHICSQWRTIALSIHQLWRAIYLPRSHVGIDHLLDVWLTRSGSCPLSLNVVLPFEEYMTAHWSNALSNLISQRTRWEHLTVTVGGSGPGSSAHLSLLNGPMPVLHHLRLDFLDMITVLQVKSAPLLCSVILSHDACMGATVELPWRQLTSLAMYWCYLDEFSTTLQRASNLVHCKLFISNRDMSINALPEISLPHLDSLVLDVNIGVADDRTIRSLITPALRHLEVSERSLGENHLETLSFFISNSTCKLDRLRIMYDDGGVSIPLERYRSVVPTVTCISASKVGAETSTLGA
ncbi:F-box domain-containing protein [Favolaschia claudopus]|uniref:F-box domain-containing protein n=1 Tax=Favolaschia claudopus TaxID=2862362 RepID=A0AAW0DSV6_9AGAR